MFNASLERVLNVAAGGGGVTGQALVTSNHVRKICFVGSVPTGKAIAKAAKPDCRTAYAELGLLAIAPLVASTVGNGGCRW